MIVWCLSDTDRPWAILAIYSERETLVLRVGVLHICFLAVDRLGDSDDVVFEESNIWGAGPLCPNLLLELEIGNGVNTPS